MYVCTLCGQWCSEATTDGFGVFHSAALIPNFFLVVPPVPLTAAPQCARRAVWPFLSLEQATLRNVFCSWFLFLVLWILTTPPPPRLCGITGSFAPCLCTTGYYSSYYLSEVQSPHVLWRNKAARHSQRWKLLEGMSISSNQLRGHVFFFFFCPAGED